MKKNTILLLFCCIVSIKVLSQSSEVKASIADLYIPDVPGFILSDKAPTAVDRPSNPRAFGVSLLNLRDGGAMEVTPFLLTNKPTYTFEKWLKNKAPVLETFNISAATFKTDSSSNLSVGFKTQLLRIFSKTTQDDILARKKEIVQLLIPKFGPDDEILPLTKEDSIAAFKKLAEIEKLKKTGYFSLEIAGAILGESDNNSFKNLSSSKSGVWVNLRWAPSMVKLNFTAVARYSWANNSTPKIGKDSSFFDAGLSLNYEQDKFNFSAEYISRKDFSAKRNYDRFTFVSNYVLTENIVLVASLGKNFTKVNNIITAFGIKLAVARSKLSL